MKNNRFFKIIVSIIVLEELAVQFAECIRNNSKYNTIPSECGFIYLSISSLVSDNLVHDPNIDDKIELNWDIRHCNGLRDDNTPDKIGLFDVNPEQNPTAKPLVMVKVSDYIWNYYVTDISLGELALPEEWTRKARHPKKAVMDPVGALCLPIWIASFKDTTLLRTNCLKLHPTWMADIRNQIADVPLSKLLIPGSHNAGSFAYGTNLARSVLQRYVLCQDRDFWLQLVSGIRYFDMRIAFYPTLQNIFLPHRNQYSQLWVNHNLIKVTPLWPVLKDIRRFLDSTTDEIVIFDIHQLPVGFYQSNNAILERHYLLLNLLRQEFSDHILEYQEVVRLNRILTGPTVSDVLRTGKRLIITYPDRNVLAANKWLWPIVKHQWGNTNDPYILKEYLDRVMANPYVPGPGGNPMWSAMAQTTPTALDIILNTEGSLRKNAEAVNRNLTTWLNHEWWSKANIISSDFFLGNNLIELMVHFNKQKGKILKTDMWRILLGL